MKEHWNLRDGLQLTKASRFATRQGNLKKLFEKTKVWRHEIKCFFKYEVPGFILWKTKYRNIQAEMILTTKKGEKFVVHDVEVWRKEFILPQVLLHGYIITRYDDCEFASLSLTAFKS